MVLVVHATGSSANGEGAEIQLVFTHTPLEQGLLHLADLLVAALGTCLEDDSLLWFYL